MYVTDWTASWMVPVRFSDSWKPWLGTAPSPNIESEHWPFGPADALATLPPVSKSEIRVPRVLSFDLEHHQAFVA